MHLSEATWTDIRDATTDLAVLPVGSTEQHGPHAPLGVDWLTAEAIAEAGVDRYADTHGEKPLVGPTIPVGVAEEHRDFDGTLWVSPDTFRSYVGETVASLASHGFERVVIVNGHGGNVDALNEVCARLTRDGDAYAVQYTWFDAVDFASLGHGGPAETAVMRHLHPELVREDRTDTAAEGAADSWGEWVSGTNLAVDSSSFTESGAVGDPREGDADLGEELFEKAAAALVELLDAVERRSLA
ncbi:creatininase domain protein [Natronomonas pharaonis DSM 2160]|uniref:Creatininase domain protein n=1 Tax=Natronomonas pharaonis (strain ATCC 35678 / DSM 2160 / CIP 103997 / JCM 8858 / NBRC 14720 / NCIMB 2260 / Gabara) TaxID=348780 RepID=A0A1U7ETP7_NATPD|nr:creatininase family protein [Natronomonas pharaonis]CAI48298.1 creatininase domain protein [Natronomonas pharaonis DSM 2160]